MNASSTSASINLLSPRFLPDLNQDLISKPYNNKVVVVMEKSMRLKNVFKARHEFACEVVYSDLRGVCISQFYC